MCRVQKQKKIYQKTLFGKIFTKKQFLLKSAQFEIVEIINVVKKIKNLKIKLMDTVMI